MLIWMRNSTFAGVFKFLLMGLLLLAVAGMVFMDRGGFFSSSVSSNTIAKGPGVNIGAVEFDRTVRRSLSSQGIGPQEAYQLGMIDNVLTSEIQNRLFIQAANKLGLEVSDDSVKRQIAKLAAPLATEGRSKKEALQQILRQQDISESEFIQTVRHEMGNSLLRAALQPPASLTSPLMAQSLYRYDNEKRDVSLIILKNDGITDIVMPTDEQLEKYYGANKNDFLIQETRTITIATLKGEMLKKNIVISDEKLKAEYDKNIASFTKPSQRLVEQAVLPTEEDAKKALASINAGKSMKDSVPADSYNGEQGFEQSGLLPEIATPVFAAKKGAVMGPIKTELGWHILIMKGTIAETVAPFDEMKDRLRTELENIALTDELYQAGNTIEDRIAAGDKLESLVTEYGMTTESFGPFRQNGMDKDGKDLFKDYGTDKAKILQTAYDYENGEIAPVVETADGQFHLIRIDAVVPDTYRDFASVKSDLQKRWVDEQKKLANQAKAKAALESLNTGKSIADIAKEDGASVQPVKNITRQDKPAAPITPIVAAQIFATDKGGNFSAEIENGYIVGKVDSIMLPAAAAPEKDLKELTDLTGRSLSQDILGLYVNALTTGKNITINRPRLEQLYAKPQEQQQQP